MRFFCILTYIFLVGLQQKDSPWEGGTRGVAAIWSSLFKNTKRVSNELMHITDWLPTLWSALGSL